MERLTAVDQLVEPQRFVNSMAAKADTGGEGMTK
jgi:hypothetical protein